MKLQIWYFVLLVSGSNSQNVGLFADIYDRISDVSNEIFGTMEVNIAKLSNNLVRLYDKYILDQDDRVWDTTENIKREYDFVIVGAGSAGCVVANRLSEISDWSVLILEAGQPETELVDVPLLAVGFQGGPYDWGYTMEPQENACLGLIDRRMPYPRGKGIGGTSLLNYMIYSRGCKEDFDALASLGNTGWSYQDVLPYFLKSEGAGDLFYAEWDYHNKTGPLSVENTFMSAVVKAVLDGGEEIGLPLYDYNAPVKKFGVSPTQSTTRSGRRFSTGRAFLAPVSKRDNLDILIEAWVTKILIDPITMKAYGVRYEKDGETHTVLARKEVVVCAGAINSPQLLMLSGIGPKNHLQHHRINVIKDIPGVGKNLLDHICFYGLVYKVLFDSDQTTLAYLTSMADFIFRGQGPLTTLGGVEGVGFLQTNISGSIPGTPDVEFMMVRGYVGTDHETFVKTAFRLTDDVYDYTYRPLENTPVWGLAPILLQPKSLGEVMLRSKDPHDPPLIFGNYYSDPENIDIKRMIAGIRIIQKLEDTAAFRSYGARISDIPVFGCQDLTFNSDEYWECALRTVSVTIYHPMGTCRMGPKSDGMAVVNNRLKVYGVKKLRVADASILQFVSGHTNAPAIMIGEHVSDFIKQDHRVI